MEDDGSVLAFCANTLRLFVAGWALTGEDGARVRLRKQLGMKGNVKVPHEVAISAALHLIYSIWIWKQM